MTDPSDPEAAWPHRMLINGRLVDGDGDVINVENPSTGQVFTQFRGASIGQVGQAIRGARKAADAGQWSGLAPSDRVAVVRRFLVGLQNRRQRIAEALLSETGCPVGSAVFPIQVDNPLALLHDHLDLYLSLPEVEAAPRPMGQSIGADGKVSQALRRYVPLGVVTAISAYNYPFFLNVWKIIPALATGNTVILRPSPLTPLSALVIGEAAVEAELPPGVLQIIAEAGAEGAYQLTTDPAVDGVAFTGSTEVGRKVMAQAATTFKRLQLELGGKSAQIFMPDKVDEAVARTVAVCLAHAGQGCSLGTRVFVPQAAKPQVLIAMAKALETVQAGDPADPATQLGPVISAEQIERCERYVKLAVDHGASVVSGGHRIDRPGHYFEPTILDLPDNANPAAQDEIFGPVVSVIGYRDLDHAIEMANDSPFGLMGYVFGADTRAALALAARLKTGTASVNGAPTMSAYISMGGHGSSGLGRERGVEGLRCYQEIQMVAYAG